MGASSFSSGDAMEIGNTGNIPIEEGWTFNKNSNTKFDPDGNEYDLDGNPIKRGE